MSQEEFRQALETCGEIQSVLKRHPNIERTKEVTPEVGVGCYLDFKRKDTNDKFHEGSDLSSIECMSIGTLSADTRLWRVGETKCFGEIAVPTEKAEPVLRNLQDIKCKSFIHKHGDISHVHLIECPIDTPMSSTKLANAVAEE